MIGAVDLRRRARRHAVVHVAMAAVLVAVILPLTLHAASSGPPAIAEFAPQALQQIKNAPNNQALGAQGGLKPTPTPTPTPTPPPGSKAALAGATPTPTPAVERGRVRQCVGSPPRQIEDPQSPPCVPYFQGDNGGATDPKHGVTATTITVATYDSDPRITADLIAFFNQRFEFYGRQLVAQNGPSPANSCAGRQSDAYTVASMPAFASADSNGDGETCYDDELSRRGVINLTVSPDRTEAQMAAQAPYAWQYSMGLDQEMANLGRWVCQRLLPGNAVHAGDPVTQGKPRKFGALVETGITSHTPDTSPLNAELQRCGSGLAATEVMASSVTPDTHKNALIDLQSKGVTSIFCFCVVFSMQNDPAAAASQGYFPEWIMSTYGADDINLVIHDYWPSQQNELMGVTFNPMQVPYADLPLVWAVHAVDPSYAFTNSLDVMARDNILYHSLLVLASGIQMAGPHLTAQSFQAGLWNTTFPNPPSPIMAGKVGFTGGSHAMTLDGAEMWYNPSAPSPMQDEGTGTWCYVGGGTRQTYDSWPRGGDPFYPASGACP